MEEVHHQYNGGHAVWTCHINTEKCVQYMATKTAQGVVQVAVFIWENDIYRQYKITLISSHCDESRCS